MRILLIISVIMVIILGCIPTGDRSYPVNVIQGATGVSASVSDSGTVTIKDVKGEIIYTGKSIPAVQIVNITVNVPFTKETSSNINADITPR